MTKTTVKNAVRATAELAVIAVYVVVPSTVVGLVNRKYGRLAAFATALGFYAIEETMNRDNDEAFVEKVDNAYDSMTHE